MSCAMPPLMTLMGMEGRAGVLGYPGKSKVGELSIIPRAILLLAPCIPHLPAQSEHALLDPVREAPPPPACATARDGADPGCPWPPSLLGHACAPAV